VSDDGNAGVEGTSTGADVLVGVKDGIGDGIADAEGLDVGITTGTCFSSSTVVDGVVTSPETVQAVTRNTEPANTK
jgi:hypothetical protein